jgi:plasmid stabilization system protein ParE
MNERRVIFHRLVQRDMNDVLHYYTKEAGEIVADRFFQTFLQVVERVISSPEYFHPVSPVLRRADITGFPYHFLYRVADDSVRILVLRHDRRHPSFGLRRK